MGGYRISAGFAEAFDKCGSCLERITLVTELLAIRPYLGVLDPTFYTHSGFKLEPWEICFPMLNFAESSLCGWGFRVCEYLKSLSLAGVAVPCHSLTVLGQFHLAQTCLTAHLPQNQPSQHPEIHSQSRLLDLHVPSATLCHVQTQFLSGSISVPLNYSPWMMLPCRFQQSFLRHLKYLPIFGPHLSPHLSPYVGEGSIFIIKGILLNFHLLSSWGAITSTGNGVSLVLVLVHLLGMWLPIAIIFTVVIIGPIIDIYMSRHIHNFHEDFFNSRAAIKVSFFLWRGRRMMGSLGGLLKVSTIMAGVIMGSLWNPSLMPLALNSKFPFPSVGTFQRWIPEHAARASHSDAHRKELFFFLYSLSWRERMVGEWMMDPIKIPWFRRPGPSWSLVYLVRGGSRPNLTEGSLSAAMGFDVIGEHTGADHNHNLVVPFGGELPGSEVPESESFILRCHLAAKPPVR
ncbi:hypothetical protein M5K25_026591 [Dendrobium thyrsiflorum]|uniref:Uncharacterized protein n=1 Tax=Dendrobium thyrsiflorum TaxID=117978 RepID=A0ABD0TXQ3_DENTH